MKGKDKCELLKSIRQKVAEQYGLEYTERECQHQGDCAGTCPRCDAELKDLQRQLQQKGIKDIELDEEIQELIDAVNDEPQDTDNLQRLQGDVPKEQEELMGQVILPPKIQNNPQQKKERTFFKECVVAGWNFHDLEETWDELYEGAELALVRDRNNKHDRNAVALALADDYNGNPDDFDFNFILGYVPRTENEMIAKMMDMGWSNAFTAELTTVRDHGSYDNRLRMTIYIQASDDCKDPKQEKVYVQFINQEEFEEVKQDLFLKGFIYRRWEELSERQDGELPQEGNKVVLLCKQRYDVRAYLMQVIAEKDSKVCCFFDNPDEVHGIADGRKPFILSNVIGPISLSETELIVSNIHEIEKGDPIHPLPGEVAHKLLMVIRMQTD